MKTFLKIIACFIVAIVGFCGGFVFNFYQSEPLSDVFVNGDISFHFMHLGNAYSGDSILIQCGETDILIDAGSRSDSASTIINYVDTFVKDNKLEYVIATHSDQDHISAFASTSSSEGVFDHYDMDVIIDFPLTNKENTSSSTVLGKYYLARDKKVQEGAKHYTALECYNNQNGAQRIYELSGGVTMEILYNYYYDHTATNENDYSVCILFSQGDNHFLFTGDLEKSGEEKLVQFYKEDRGGLPHCKLFKAGHHGSKTSSNLSLLKQITPEIVVVCCVAGSEEYTQNNDNTFPTQIFVDNIAQFTSEVYVTGLAEFYQEGEQTKVRDKELNGNIQITFHSTRIEKKFSGSDKPLKESEWFKSHRTCPTQWL